MNRVFDPSERFVDFFDGQWWPILRFGWPRDFRRFMFYIFAGESIGFLVPAFYKLSQFHNLPLLRNLLAGPIFDLCVIALSGIAAWTIWKAHPSARGWAIAASVPFVFIFIRPFLIPMHTILDHNLISLVVGLVGVAAFTWPD